MRGVNPEPAAQVGVNAARRGIEKDRGAGPLAAVREGKRRDVRAVRRREEARREVRGGASRAGIAERELAGDLESAG